MQNESCVIKISHVFTLMSSNTWSVVKLVVDWDLRVVLCAEKRKNQIKDLPHNTGVSQITLINKYYYNIFSIVSNISSYYLGVPYFSNSKCYATLFFLLMSLEI